MENLQNNSSIERVMENVLRIQENSLTTNELIKAKIIQHDSMINALSTQFGTLENSVQLMQNDIADLKWNEEITDEQVRTIQARIKERVCKVLDYPNGDSSLYYQTFISNIYAFLRNSFCLGSRTATTKKKFYDTVMKGIDAWYPDVEELKSRKHKRVENTKEKNRKDRER